ncbi:unnamed protein product [Agarophyton chilense]
MRTHHIPSSGLDPFVGKRVQFDCELKRLWRRFTCPSKRENFIMIMQKRNYKVYADIDSDKDLLTRRLTVLDTGGGPSFIRISELGPTDQEQIRYDRCRCSAAPYCSGPDSSLYRRSLEFADVSDESTGAYEGLKEQSQQTEKQRDPDKLVGEIVLENVPEEYKERIKQMLKKYASMWTGKLGENSATDHHIGVIPGSRSVSQPPYRAGRRTRQIEEDNVAKMLKAGGIEAAQSAWPSPVVLVPKPDGSL